MSSAPTVAIIDFGLGNLYSILRACQHVGLNGKILSDPAQIKNAPAIILPGVGAFGDAMKAIQDLGLEAILKEAVHAEKPVMGICLGMQLLMSKSFEFGEHRGLDIVPGDVVRFEKPKESGEVLKVPHVGWNRINPPAGRWGGAIMDEVEPGDFMYFVHSYYVRPADRAVVLAESQYGQTNFCSALRFKNVFAFQFHPERSGEAGLRIYRNFARLCQTQKEKTSGHY